MPSIAIRNVPDEVHRAIRIRAAMPRVVPKLKSVISWSRQ